MISYFADKYEYLRHLLEDEFSEYELEFVTDDLLDAHSYEDEDGLTINTKSLRKAIIDENYEVMQLDFYSHTWHKARAKQVQSKTLHEWNRYSELIMVLARRINTTFS